MIDFARMRELIRQEERLRWAIEKQTAKATKITASFSATGGGSGKTGSQVEEGAIMLAALKDEHSETERELQELQGQLKHAMKMIRNGVYRSAIGLRYLPWKDERGRTHNGHTQQAIADVLGYDRSRITQIIGTTEALINKAQKPEKSHKKIHIHSPNFLV